MAADELRFRVSADGADEAAREVGKVQDAVDKLEGTAAQVTVEADDEATAVLDEAQGSVDDLDGADATVAVDADDEATDPLEGVQGAVDSLDGSGATVTAEADDEASDVLADVAGAVGDIDGESAEVTLEADDQASGPLGDVTGKIGALGDAAGSLPGPLGEISSLIGEVGASGIGAAGGIGALVAGIAAIGMQGVNQFKDLAIEVDNFSTKTGASLDASSRFVEVAKDLDIGVANIETSLGRMNKVAGETPAAFDDIGASLVRNDQGNVDSVETFISVLDALNKMPDASSRAKAGNEIFGRGWQNMSELVGMSADELRTRLQSVDDIKIFDEAKVAKGQGMRDALDAISDASDALFLSLGQELAPAVEDLAPALGQLVTAAGPLIELFGESLASSLEIVAPLIDELGKSIEAWSSLKLPSWLGPLKTTLDGLTNPLGAAKDNWDKLTESFGGTPKLAGDLQVSLESVGAAQEHVARSAEATAAASDLAAAASKRYEEGLKAQADTLQENIDKQNELSGAMGNIADSTIDLQEKSASFTETLAKYNETAADGTAKQSAIDKALRDTVKSADALAESVVNNAVQQDVLNGKVTSATSKLDTQNQSLLAQAATARGPARQAVLDYTFALNQIPPDVQTQIQALIDQGRLDEANAMLADASRNRQATIRADADNRSLNQANADLEWAARNRESTIFIKTSGAGFMLGSTTSGGPRPSQPSAGGGSVVPVAVEPAATATATRAGPSHVTYVTNNVMVPRIPSGRELERVAQRWSRVNGRT